MHTTQIAAGEGGAKRRMGCGPPLRSRQACATMRASLRRRIPAFHTPSVGLRPTPSPLRGEGGAQPPDIRDLAFLPLLPPNVTIADVRRGPARCGEERYAAVMFVDMRGSTRRSEKR